MVARPSTLEGIVMWMEIATLAVAMITSLLINLPAWLAARRQAREAVQAEKESDANLQTQVAEMAKKWLTSADARIEALEQDLEDTRRDLKEAQEENRTQKRLLAAQGEQIIILSRMANQSQDAFQALVKRLNTILKGSNLLATQIKEMGEIPVWDPPKSIEDIVEDLHEGDEND